MASACCPPIADSYPYGSIFAKGERLDASADRHEEEVPDAAFGVVVGTFHTVGYNRESEPPEQHDCLRAVCFFPY
jgi:hypothetical protein